MKLPPRSALFGLVLLAFMVIIVFTAVGYPARARLVPLAVGVPTTGLLLWQLFSEVLFVPGKKEEAPAKLAASKRGQRDAGLVKALGWMTTLLVMLYLLGFLVGLPLFLFLFLKFQGKEEWLTSTVLPVLTGVVLYVVFVKAFGILLYEGLFFQL